MRIVDVMFPTKVAEPNEIRAIVAEFESKNPAEVALAEVRVAVAQLRELRLGEMSAKEEQLLGVIWERVK